MLQANQFFLENAENIFQHKNFKQVVKKCLEACNHPFLIKTQLKNNTITSSEFDKFNLSGKMIVLDKLLLNMNRKNKVIIISQMNEMLNFLEEYLILKKYEFSRLDRQIRGQQRQKALDLFNDQEKDFYILLLNSMAGLKGINFTSANTVIVYDSDVKLINEINFGHSEIYYLISNESCEQIMLKFLIENLEKDIIIRDDDYEKILRYGAYYTFNNKNEELINKVDKTINENISDFITRSKSNKLIEINENILNLNILNFWNYYLHEEHQNNKTSELKLIFILIQRIYFFQIFQKKVFLSIKLK